MIWQFAHNLTILVNTCHTHTSLLKIVAFSILYFCWLNLHIHFAVIIWIVQKVKNVRVFFISTYKPHSLCTNFMILLTLWNSELGEILVHLGYNNFTMLHQNQMKKKVLLRAHFSVQNFKVSVELWKSYIVYWVVTG